MVNTDVEKVQFATFDKLHAVTQMSTIASVLRVSADRPMHH